MAIKLRLAPRAALKAKVSPRLGAAIAGGDGILVSLAGNVYTLAADPAFDFTLGAIGETIQAWDADLDALAAGGPAGHAFMANGAGTGAYQGFTANGANAVTRTWAARNKDWVNATDYDTFDHAVVAALAAGKPLYVPAKAGGYTSAGNLALTNGATIIGESKALVGVNVTSATAPLFNIIGSYVTVSGLQIGATVTRTASANGYINVTNAGNVTIKDNLFAGAFNGIVGNGNSLLRIEGNQIAIVSGGVGISLGGTTGGIAESIFDNIFSGAGFASIVVTQTGDLTLRGNQVGGASHGLYVNPQSGQGVVSIKSIGNWWDQATTSNITFIPNAGAISRSSFNSDWIAGPTTSTNVSIGPLGGGMVNGIEFNNCEVYLAAAVGIAVDGTAGTIGFIDITDCAFGQNGTAILFTNVNKGIINGNAIGATGGFTANTTGIVLTGTTDNIVIAGNVVTGNGTNYNNTSSGTSIKVRSNIGFADSPVLTVAEGGTGAATLTGLLQGNGTGAFTAIANSSTTGQVLRVMGASTYAWGALDLADSDAITGDLPFANLTQGSARSVLGVTGNASADFTSIQSTEGTLLFGQASSLTFTATPVLGVAGSTVGTLGFRNATSGTITLSPPTGALGTVTLTLPAATDTLVGKATTDTFTNKTFDTAGSGNVFRINGTAISAVTGSGSAVLATSPTFVTDARSPLFLATAGGSVSAPAHSFSGDSNTGMYSPGPDQLALAIGGSEKVSMNSTGVGINVSVGSIDSPLLVGGTPLGRSIISHFTSAAGAMVQFTDAGAKDWAFGVADVSTSLTFYEDRNVAADGTLRLELKAGGEVSAPGSVVARAATAIPAGGTAGAGFMFSSTSNYGVFFGSGAPTLSAAKGSLYLRSDGSTTNDRMYVNTNGSTTWTAVTTAA